MKWSIIVRDSRLEDPAGVEDSFTSGGRLWPPRAAPSSRPRGRTRELPSRRAAGKKELDLFEITLAIGHQREDRAPRYLIEKRDGR